MYQLVPWKVLLLKLYDRERNWGIARLIEYVVREEESPKFSQGLPSDSLLLMTVLNF
jgi:hypothetical protein